VPSGSCAGMIKEHYPDLFATDTQWRSRAQSLAARCYELTEFLRDVLEVENVEARYAGTCTYHDSCSGLRELNIKQQPRDLLTNVDGLSINEMHESNVCCGFGGTFCVKYPEISGRMVTDKVAHVRASNADTLLGGDMGCLLNIAGRLKREGSDIKVYHIAEVLANKSDVAPIGEREAN